MKPERMAELVRRWVRLYTRNLPSALAERRIGEIDADLHDHIAHERACGTADRRIALSMASRMVRGLAADASWRGRMIRTGATPMSTPAKRSLVRVGLVTALVLLVPLVAMQFTDEVDFGVFDFVLAGLFVGGAGLLIEAAVRNPRSIVFRAAAGAIGIASILLGEGDDAPGLVLFGLLLILATVVLSLRTAQRSE